MSLFVTLTSRVYVQKFIKKTALFDFLKKKKNNTKKQPANELLCSFVLSLVISPGS